jgi:hypothetical protein
MRKLHQSRRCETAVESIGEQRQWAGMPFYKRKPAGVLGGFYKWGISLLRAATVMGIRFPIVMMGRSIGSGLIMGVAVTVAFLLLMCVRSSEGFQLLHDMREATGKLNEKEVQENRQEQ